jgi:putative restriction endonuclease
MCNEGQRELLRAALIETYFEPALQTKLAAQGVINQQAFRYGQELLRRVKAEKRIEETAEPAYAAPARDQGFRRVVTQIYDHRCALCGIRMRTPEGHTVVDAAHIIPFSESRNDDPRNGMALCRLCHWAFDEGLLGVNVEYVVRVSPRLRAERNVPAHLATLDGRGMITPAEREYWPAIESLKWHVGNVFRTR